MKKLFVLDTNVLIYDPRAIFNFADNDVAIPITVLEELDNLKTSKDDTGFNAREASRQIELFRETGDFSDLSSGVEIPGGGRLYIITENIEFNFKYLKDSADNYILGITRRLADELAKVVLITKDVNLRIKADAFGIAAEDYWNDSIINADKIGLVKTIQTDVETLNCIHSMLKIQQNEIPHESTENESCIIKTCSGGQSAMVRFNSGIGYKIQGDQTAYGIKPKNSEQHFLLDALMDRSIDLVICAGVAGAGKTLLSLAAGLESVSVCKHDFVLITKAIQAVGQDIGFLPGTKEEKINEWIAPYYDNLELLMHKKSGKALQQILDNEIEVEAITYMRGRSLMRRFVIVDECQNLTKSQIKTIISRVHDSSKLVLLGDLQQIDNPYLTLRDNGLSYAMSKLSDTKGVVVLNMLKGERGRLARLAIEKL